MSQVTSVILKLPVAEEKKINLINKWLLDQRQIRKTCFLTRMVGDGPKVVDQPTFIGGFNYFPSHEFKEFIKSIEWDLPEEVQLLVCEEHEERYVELL